MESIPDTSATLIFDGVTYTIPENEFATFLELDGNTTTPFAVTSLVNNGTDTLSLGILVPDLIEGNVYTKADDGANASVTVVLLDETSYSSLLGDDLNESLTDYTIRITEVTNSTVSGTFSATVYNPSNEDSAEVSGSFVATSFSRIVILG